MDPGRPMADVEVSPSSIAELGVFAARAFETNETVIALDDSRLVDDEHPLQPERGEFHRHQDYVARGRVVLMGVPERYINSSCDPNTYVVTRGDTRYVVALRSIRQGEEITYDYLLNCDGGATWQCRCGTACCRGTIPASFFDLPLDEQRRLRPLLDDWFVAEHADRISR
jgi:SET domain-containing protein